MNRLSVASALFVVNMAVATGVTAQVPEPVASCSQYESVPLPAEAEKVVAPKTAPECASYKSYRGIGRPVDYAAARACAWKERPAEASDLYADKDKGWEIGGSLILADIYFNGAGVKRNVPLAMRLACESDEGMAGLALEYLEKGDTPHHSDGLFEFCDYAPTTITMNFCMAYELEVVEARRDRFYRSVKAKMIPEQQAAFVKLLAAEKEYVRAHASEVDQGGTIRGVRTMGSMDILKDLFRTDVVHFERKNWPRFSSAQNVAADAVLKREYAKALTRVRTQTKEEAHESMVTADDIAKVETAWLAYRDAWVAFASLRYPGEVDAIRAKVTFDRSRLLKVTP